MSEIYNYLFAPANAKPCSLKIGMIISLLVLAAIFYLWFYTPLIKDEAWSAQWFLTIAAVAGCSFPMGLAGMALYKENEADRSIGIDPDWQPRED